MAEGSGAEGGDYVVDCVEGGVFACILYLVYDTGLTRLKYSHTFEHNLGIFTMSCFHEE